jgi:hypothetical protein
VRYSAGLLLLAALLLAPGTAMADGLISLQQALLRHGFRIEVRQPPGKAYGRFLSNQKLLEISPLVQELGITRPVLLHEAVHAAQSCPSGTLTLIGIQRRADPAVESRIRYLLSNHYRQEHMALEQEAFLVQGQDDAEALVVKALNERCQPPLK